MKVKAVVSFTLIFTVLCCSALYPAAEEDIVLPLEGYKASGLYTEEQYDYVKERIAKKEEPWFSAYNKMISLAQAWIDEEPSAVERWYVPGFYTDEKGHKAARAVLMNDAKSAYACAVAYKFTYEKRYAEQAVRILDDWTKLKTLGAEDSGLVFSYVGNALVMSAELIKGYPEWKNKPAFDKWVKEYYLSLANKGWSTGNSGDWNLFARSVGYAYLGDTESLKNIIAGDEEQSGSLKYLISRIRSDGILHKELERGSNGLWYSYFALAPMTACCQVLYNTLGEDCFNFTSSQGRSVKQAVDTFFYYCNHTDEWNQVYNDYYNGTKTTSVSYPSALSSTSYPLPLFEAMAGVYNNQDFCDYVGRYRPVYGTVNDGLYHHFAWFFPTLMYGSLQLGGGLPQYTADNADRTSQRYSDFAKIQYYQNFEGEYETVHSKTASSRDKYALKDGDTEIYYVETASDEYSISPISLSEDSVYGGKSAAASMSNNAKVVLNLPQSYNSSDGLISLEMRWYRPSDVSTLGFYERPVDDAYNIPKDNSKAAYIYHVKYERFFFNSTKSNAAELPSGKDYYNYNSGSWTWLKLDFDFDKDKVSAYYKDARNGGKWIPWTTTGNVFDISGKSIGSLVFEGKGNARIDDIKITAEPVYIDIDNNMLNAIVKNAESGLPYEWQTAENEGFSEYFVAQNGVYDGSAISVPYGFKGAYMRFALNGKATYPVMRNNFMSASPPELYRYNKSGNTDWRVDSLSGIASEMYAVSTVKNNFSEPKSVLIAAAGYNENNALVGININTEIIPAKSCYTVSTEAFGKYEAEKLKIFVIDPNTLTEYTVGSVIPKW